MKKLFTSITIVLLTATLWAQSPLKLSYQAVIRDAGGKLVINQAVGIRISLLQGSATGTEVYNEIYNPNRQTNANGLVTIEIGNGVALTGTFSTINWANGPYFIKTETDPSGGANYTIIGTSQLLSVPYALYAKTAESISGGITEVDPLFSVSAAKKIKASDTVRWSNKLSSYNEVDPLFGASVAKGIKVSDTTRWSNKLNSYTETDPIFNASLAKGIKTSDTAKWNAKSNFSGSYTDLKNKPTLLDNATIVSTSGDQAISGNKTFFNDLTINSLTVGKGKGDNYYNTALGSNALTSNITGSYNTANGYAALYYTSTGSNNTANGYYSLVYNTTGYSNTAVGNLSLSANTTGNANTANGNSALYHNTTGGSNTAVGFYSLGSNVSGNNNTVIGSYADVGSGTLYNATAIGAQTVVDASNKIRIGNNDITVIEGKVAFTSLSDRRVKKNIKDISSGLDFILKLRPVEYQMKRGDDKINFGFIAQDIETLIGANNSLLTIGADTAHTLGLRYSDFIAPLVKAIQEQQKLIAELSKQNIELKDNVADLKSVVGTLQGMQQPFKIAIVTGDADANGITLQCSAFPNPMSENLTLKINGELSQPYIAYLYDIHGKLLETQKVEANETSIGMKNFDQAVYFLKVILNNEEIKIFKIIKN